MKTEKPIKDCKKLSPEELKKLFGGGKKGLPGGGCSGQICPN